jgi:hypothetical protein
LWSAWELSTAACSPTIERNTPRWSCLWASPNRFETFTDSDQGATRYPTLGEISKRVAASYFTPALWMPSKMFEAPDAAA